MLIDAVATHGKSRGNALALLELDSGRQWNWAELDGAVNRAAHWLIGQIGPASGARVATVSRNCAEMILLQFGCIRAGAIFVPVNWRLAPNEVAHILEDAGPAILFSQADLHVDDFGGTQFDIVKLPEMFAELPGGAVSMNARRDWSAASTLLYTSGTSGKPKGVMLSEENAYWSATNFNLGNGVSSASTFLCDLPLFHTAGLFTAARAPLLAGGAVLLSHMFDPANTLTAFADAELAITHYFSVPQMAQILWNHPEFDASAFARLQVYATGGAPNPAAQIERFVGAGIPMSDGFGMTETGSNLGMPVDDRGRLIAKAGSCGLPYLSLELRIVDGEGNDLGIDEAGQLLVRGPSVFQGYWQQPAKTAEAFVDGWFRTGDIARRDEDNFVYLVDRAKDMFISGGENVYPAEVEAVIAELDEVAECAVIGIKDEQWGEVGEAFVIAVEGQLISAENIIAHCKENLAGYKVPKSVVVTDEIPRTASGKVQKHILREQSA